MDIKRRLDVFIRQNSVDICSFLQHAKISQFDAAGAIQPVTAREQSTSDGDNNMIFNVGDRLSALMSDYAALRVHTSNLIDGRYFSNLASARLAAESRKSRDHSNRVSVIKVASCQKSAAGSTATSRFMDFQQQQRVKIHVQQNQQQRNNSSTTSVVSNSHYPLTNASKILMKCDVTVGVERKQIYANETSVSAAVHVSVTQ
jgi:hypothetical protein